MLLIRNGRLIDPASGTQGERDILIQNGTIARIAPHLRDGDLPPAECRYALSFP